MAMKADVVLPAAGTSVRMKMQVAKQFQEVCGHPILAYTVDAFHRLPWIRHIVVVVDPLHLDHTRCILDKYAFHRVIVCTGGKTRHRSIFNGVQALRDVCEESDVVLIHDAARPFVPEHVAERVAAAAKANKAAGVTRPLVSTVIRGDDDATLMESLDRQIYRNSEMPQAFQYSVIAEAYSKCTEYDLDYGTECLLLALKYAGCAAHLVEGTDDLWKVTYQKDLYAMESIVKEKLSRLAVINTCTYCSSFSTEMENKIMGWPFQMAISGETPANTFIVFTDYRTETRTQSSQVDLISSSVAKTCGCPSSSSQISLTPFIVLVFVRISKKLDDNTLNSYNSIGSQELDLERNGTSHPKREENRNTCLRSEKYRKLDTPCENSHTSTIDACGAQTSSVSEGPGKINSGFVLDDSKSLSMTASRSLDKDACLSTLVQVKKSLTGTLDSRTLTVVGIQVEDSHDSIADRLLSLIWHRSSYLDGQLLDWT